MRPHSNNDDDRRQEKERCQFSYTVHVPERRSGMNRRCVESRKITIGDE